VPLSRLEILGHALSGTPVTVASSTSGSQGLVTVATPADYALAVDGSETSGSYQYTVQYTAIAP
jgi:hypothetical protein